MVGSSVSVCYAFVNLSLPGCDAVQVWERVNPVRCAVMLLRDMAGAGVVKVLRFLCRVSLLSASERFFLSVVCILTRSHTDSKASGLLCPRVLTAE